MKLVVSCSWIGDTRQVTCRAAWHSWRDPCGTGGILLFAARALQVRWFAAHHRSGVVLQCAHRTLWHSWCAGERRDAVPATLSAC